jgi:hypothetical protein
MTGQWSPRFADGLTPAPPRPVEETEPVADDAEQPLVTTTTKAIA